MDDRKIYMVAVLIQAIFAGMSVISKAALDNGLSSCVFVFYRQAVASIVLAPIAILQRKKSSPPLHLVTLINVFLHSLGITLTLNMLNAGLKDTSATLASACTQTLPVLTFFLAVLLRIEGIKMRSLPGSMKMVGMALCLAGTLVMAFYKGPHLKPLIHHHPIGHSSNQNGADAPSSDTNWIKGTFFVIIANVSFSLWLVLQSFLLKDCPDKVLFTTLECIFSTIQSFLVALVLVRDFSKWKLKLDVGILAIVYSAVVVTAISFYLQSWCVEKKGPVVVAMFTPLALVFTMICSTLFLGELIHLGSILGGILLVGGLYSVLWGKRKESALCDTSNEEGKHNNIVDKETASPCRLA